MNNTNNKANQQIGKHKTTTSSQPIKSNPHASNTKYDDATSNKNPNDNVTYVTNQGKRNLSSSSQTSSTSDQVGGRNSTDVLNSAEVYDITTKQWRMISSMSGLREGFGVGVLNNLLYAVGGFFAGSVLDTVECYNPSLDSWTQITRMSERRLGASVAVLNGLLYVVGGHNNEDTLKSVETYNPNNGVWTSVANMHKRRAFAGVFTLDGLLYVLGGKNTCGVLPSTEIYNPKTNIWSMKSLSKCDILFCDGVVVNMAPNFRTHPWSDYYLM
ncbi:hypothetical protein ACI65C_004131 [Semiaphis heraclei]